MMKPGILVNQWPTLTDVMSLLCHLILLASILCKSVLTSLFPLVGLCLCTLFAWSHKPCNFKDVRELLIKENVLNLKSYFIYETPLTVDHAWLGLSNLFIISNTEILEVLQIIYLKKNQCLILQNVSFRTSTTNRIDFLTKRARHINFGVSLEFVSLGLVH